MSVDLQPVFRALADPTRRAIVEILHKEPSAIAPLVTVFEMSRPAVAKHLRILEDAGLIHVEEKGRERINHLQLSQLKLASRWIAMFDRFWDEKLEILKKNVEEDNDKS